MFFTKMTRMRTLSIDLVVARKPILEEDLVTCILSGLGDAYGNVVVSILARPIPVTLEEVYAILLNHEGRMTLQKNNEYIEANMAVKSGKGNTSNWGNKKIQFESSSSLNNRDYYDNNLSGKTRKIKGKAKVQKQPSSLVPFVKFTFKERYTTDECWHMKDDNYVPRPPSRRQQTYTPQMQQGQTVASMTTLALLAQSKLPLKFWGDACKTAIYLINRLPTSVLNHKCPYAKLHQNELDYNLLKTFECAYYPHLRPYNNHKL